MADRTTVEELLKASNDAAVHARTIWVTYLLFGTYLAIAIGSTTHRDLLLENPVTLPLLSVGLNLVTFFWVAPLMFVIYHLYTLLAHFVLAGKLHEFNRALASTNLFNSVQEEVRWRLHSSFVVQAIAGPERSGLVTFGMRAITWITLALAPAILLLAFQIRFLPYHDPLMTWCHRGFLLVDVALVWALWPLVLHPSGRWSDIIGEMISRTLSMPIRIVERIRHEGRDLTGRLIHGTNRWATFKNLWRWQRNLNRETQSALRSISAAGQLALLSMVMIFISIAVATVPGEDIERSVLRLVGQPETWIERKIAEALPVETIDGRQILAVTAAFFDGQVDQVSQRPATPFSRNLVLIDEDLSGNPDGIRLRGRDLRFANFAGSHLTNADLSAALLTQANLRGATLTNAKLEFAQLERADLSSAALEYANLDGANLRGANLQSALFDGASMISIRLQGAYLWGTHLQGANLIGAELLAATLGHAQLQAADMNGADLRATYLGNADFQGTNLIKTRLHGAVVRDANLKSADLSWSELQGADLSGARIELANFWESDFSTEIDWSTLRAEVEREVPNVTIASINLRDRALESLKISAGRGPGSPARPAEGLGVNFDQNNPGIPPDWPLLEYGDFEMKVARHLSELACENQPIAKSIILVHGSRDFLANNLVSQLRESDCLGLKELSEETKRHLRRIATKHQDNSK